MNCCVPFCKTNRSNLKSLGASFHEFPCDLNLKQQWVNNIKIYIDHDNIQRKDFTPGERAVVCSLHFTSNDYCDGSKVRRLKPGARPTVFQSQSEHSQIATAKRKEHTSQKVQLEPPKKIRKVNRKTVTTVEVLIKATDDECFNSLPLLGLQPQVITTCHQETVPPSIAK